VVLFSVKKRDENWDKGSVVAQTLDGGARRVLVEGASDGRYLPTGHLVYARSGVVMAARFDVATLAIRGSEVPILEGISRGSMPGTGTGTMHVSLSASGSVAYVPGPATIGLSDGWDLAVFERKGTFQPLKLSRRPYQSPRVSPDGRWVAVDSVDDNEAAVWVMDMTGAAAERRLTFGDRSRAPVWSPDGQWIAYQSDREKDLAIFRQRADGAGAPERLTKPEADAAHVPESWSPDGSVLLFSESKAARYSLVSLMLKDRTAKPVTGMESSIASQAVFSPDGHWITYQVRGLSPVETGVAQSFVQSFPGGTKYLVPHAGGHPFWSLQGKELMLNAGPNQNVTIAVTTSPRLEFGQPVEFSRAPRVDSNPNQSRRNTDILPDGERVIGRVVTGSTGAVGLREGGIVVVVNWIDELRQRVP
jgi:serine/threonine-protein kinase